MRTLAGLYGAFALLGGLRRLFEGTETNRRLRDAGLAPAPLDRRDPFVPQAFFGEIVHTGSPGATGGGPANQARSVFYSGVVVRALGDGLVAPREAGRPELQVGIALSRAGRADVRDDADVEKLRAALGPAWSVAPLAGGGCCLAVREDALRFIERADYDRAKLLRARRAFFDKHWDALAQAPESAFHGLLRVSGKTVAR